MKVSSTNSDELVRRNRNLVEDGLTTSGSQASVRDASIRIGMLLFLMSKRLSN